MTTNSGIIPITQKSFTPGATSPRSDAIMQQNNMNQRQNNLNKVAGGSRKRKYRGGANQIAVPQFQMQYKPTGGPGTNPNDQIAANSQTYTQSKAWSASDAEATKMGGRRRIRKGGNPNWSWGCYSGGKTKRRHHSRKKYRKTRRHRRR